MFNSFNNNNNKCTENELKLVKCINGYFYIEALFRIVILKKLRIVTLKLNTPIDLFPLSCQRNEKYLMV